MSDTADEAFGLSFPLTKEQKNAIRDKARERYTVTPLIVDEGRIEVDDGAQISLCSTGDGAWVQAWVYIDEQDLADLRAQEND